MRHVVRPFPWWSLAHLALGIVMVPVVAVVLFALAATAPLAVTSIESPTVTVTDGEAVTLPATVTGCRPGTGTPKRRDQCPSILLRVAACTPAA